MCKKKPQQLYWCTTPSHEEDWFIQASSLEEAQQSHECFEGFNEGDAKAKFVCNIPSELWETEPRWPFKETLVELGFEFLQEGAPRRVRKDGVVFTERTYMTSVYPTWRRHQQLLLYVVNLRTTTKYKIGYSANFENRFKQIQSHNPFYVDIVALLPHPLAKKWERELKDRFNNWKTNNEWFDLDNEAAALLMEELDQYRILSLDHWHMSRDKDQNQ